MCRESAFDGRTAEQCIALMRACWDSEWDILPDDLTYGERMYAGLMGKLSDECKSRLARDLGHGQ